MYPRKGDGGQGIAVWLVVTAIVAGMLWWPEVRAQSAPKSNASLAARVQRLEDIEEIKVLLTDYGRLLDTLTIYADIRSYSRRTVSGLADLGRRRVQRRSRR